MSTQAVTLDVREEIRNGRDPFSKITGAVETLPADGELLIIAPFEPAPLFHVMAAKGFQHAAQKIGPAHWEVRFTRTTQNTLPTMPSPQTAPAAFTGEVLEVDARRLEPPQPLVKILEALATLPDGAELRARTDRRPIHLHSHLAERGYTGQSEEQTDGSFITHIRHI